MLDQEFYVTDKLRAIERERGRDQHARDVHSERQAWTPSSPGVAARIAQIIAAIGRVRMRAPEAHTEEPIAAAIELRNEP